MNLILTHRKVMLLWLTSQVLDLPWMMGWLHWTPQMSLRNQAGKQTMMVMDQAMGLWLTSWPGQNALQHMNNNWLQTDLQLPIPQVQETLFTLHEAKIDQIVKGCLGGPIMDLIYLDPHQPTMMNCYLTLKYPPSSIRLKYLQSFWHTEESL